MCFGVLNNSIILMGGVFKIHCKSLDVEGKIIVLALNITECHFKHFQSCILEMVKLIIKPGNIFPPQVWSSIRFLCINCKFSRCLDQLSHRNNKLLSLWDSWHGMNFEFALQISPSGSRSWFLTQLTAPLDFYYKWHLTYKLYTLFFWDKVMSSVVSFYRGFTEPSFHFIPCTEIKI